MAERDELWNANLWPECIHEPALVGLPPIPDAEHMLHMMDSGSGDRKPPSSHDGDAADGPKDVAPGADTGDDVLDLEPPAKLQATGKLDSQTAKTKAFREKQRRAQLNNRYTELAALIDPNKPPKTDRNLILDDAVRVITQLRVENNQLRQLNKLLEERVQEQEAPRGQALYQSYLMSQGGLQPSARPDGASTSAKASIGAAADAGIDMARASQQGSAAGAPSQDPSTLAMQMMNVAMQLLQNRSDGQGAPGMPPGALQNPAQWPPGMVPPMPPGMPTQAMHSGAHTGVPAPYPDSQGKGHNDAPQSGSGAATGEDAARSGGAATQEEGRENPAVGSSVPVMGFKPHMMMPQPYMHGYGFQPMPGMWPHATMMDQARDSKLRPPAA